MMLHNRKARLSANGFYCNDCKSFVYLGLTDEDLEEVERGRPVCIKCAKNYEFKDTCNHESHFISSMTLCEKCGADRE